MPDFTKNENLVTGLEWDDPLQVNRLSTSEERRLSLLLTKIAVKVNMKKLVLRPYFQDYELVKFKAGAVFYYNNNFDYFTGVQKRRSCDNRSFRQNSGLSGNHGVSR